MTITPHDDREKAILQWLSDDLHLTITRFQPASSDASFRRYYRIEHERQSYIVMDAPPEKEDTAPFIKVAQLFQQAHINVPNIVQQNTWQGFLLLEDFGSTCYLDRLNDNNATPLYTDALNSLLQLQSHIKPQDCNLPPYNAALLQTELQLFSDWFLSRQCQYTLNGRELQMLDSSYQLLIESALQQAQVCVHRDYHSRNLMYVPHNNPGIIDFQDAVIGPITYDAVSLLRDCYIRWPDTLIEQQRAAYYQQLKQAGLIHCAYPQFCRDFDLMGIQRHLKAIGIFSRLNIRDGKPAYLKDIPRTLHYVIQISRQYPELQALHQFLNECILPISRQI